MTLLNYDISIQKIVMYPFVLAIYSPLGLVLHLQLDLISNTIKTFTHSPVLLYYNEL